MIYCPETIDTISTVSPIYLHTFFLNYARELTLCMLASWSHEGVVFLDLLPSPHSVTSFLLPCPGSTDALCPRLGDPVPLPPKWRPYSQGPRTLPYRDREHYSCFTQVMKTLRFLNIVFTTLSREPCIARNKNMLLVYLKHTYIPEHLDNILEI